MCSRTLRSPRRLFQIPRHRPRRRSPCCQSRTTARPCAAGSMRTFKDQGPVHPEDSAAARPDDHTGSRRRSGQRRLADIVDDDTRKGTGMSAQRGIAHLASLTWTQSAGPAMDKMRPPRDRDSGHLAPPEECRPGTLRRRPRPCRSPKKMAPPGRPASRRRGSTSPSVGTTPAPRMDRRSARRWRRTRRPVAPQAVARYRCRRTPAPRAVGA